MLIQKEQSHQYMIIGQTPDMDEFALHMITENEIPGLIPCRQRMFNGERNLYYDITGKCPLSDNGICLGGTAMHDLLQSLFLVMEKLTSYFLPEDGICLGPDTVFVENGVWSFCYFPQRENNLRENCIRFSEELLGKIDQEDEQAVVLAYRFYQMVKRENDTLHHVIEQLLYGEENRQRETKLQQKYHGDRSEYAENTLRLDMQQEKADEAQDGLQDRAQQTEPGDLCADGKKSPEVDLFALLLFGLLLCGSIGVSCYLIFVWQVGSFWDFLSLREGILSVAFLLLSLGGIAYTCLPIILRGASLTGWLTGRGSENHVCKSGQSRKQEKEREKEKSEENTVFEIPQIDLK